MTVTATSTPINPLGSDFNGDGWVDGQDLVIWQNNFPILSGATPGQGDADGDGDVDGFDFMLWQTKNGGPPAVAVLATVPEPTTGLLLVLGGLLLAATTFRPRRMCPVRVRR